MSHHAINAFLHYLVKYKCKKKLTIIHTLMKKILQTIAVNNPYDFRLCVKKQSKLFC